MKKDWCTLWPEGNWAHCCKRHDNAFDNGIPFFKANWRLFKCVRRKAGIVVAFTMLMGTTLVGWIPYLKARMALKKKQQ